ncbi:MAG: LLM class flavin-dependent oxidoreductase, partial [Maritimibacter sp.]|nr:LLM class flavin-dependent oxidoreductase [Maritimibacter sp.]
RIDHAAGGVWLAVTSLSFDISVLELFWTLARGFKLVISGDESRALVSGEGTAAAPVGGAGLGGMDFSLYYWGNDDGRGRGKYRSLLEGAKFADENGFVAVWTPERHFHAFGGPYPNPSVTGAAVAGFTKNIGVRAGSCVSPLHHTARIAEEWSIIDNLTEGRAGLAVASGWQPDDFVLRPENTPPENKTAMFRQIADLRKLWAGEPVAFPRKDGEMHEVITQPRPISKTLDLWVTTAGNPDTWREAGRNGCHVLTHLLGQSIDEVAGKIKIYHEALREAGHDPAHFKVTLMLHTFLSDSRDHAREIAREPMKDYLRSAAALIKQYAWAFPAFKKPKGVENSFQLDLGILSPSELEEILDFAFERYFNDSGLFGTVDDALARVAQVKEIGVTEVACLIDYGIDVDTLLAGLRPLAEVVRAVNADVVAGPAAGDYSIAAQIRRHGVTHLQCTPSMARMLVMNDEAGAALAQVKHICLGGEALPGSLVNDIAALTKAHVENMYGPTETTIWSTTGTATGAAGVVGIGTPIANTQVYILDAAMQPQPIGVPGELWIGGDGVTRGYWRREDLTAERFVADPFSTRNGARLYRTGDLARWLPAGGIEFLGRTDFQVKLRGYRIELGEIETALDALDGVRQSVVVVREDAPGVQMLVGYLLADGPVDEAALKTALAAELPAHMIPARFVALDAFPLTPNRKVDRKALPVPPAPGLAARPKPAAAPAAAPAAGAAQPEAAGPDIDVETEIAQIWTATLGVANISARDNFFDLGGHSLLAVQAHREIKAKLGVQTLSITDIFRHPVLEDLAAAVTKKLGAGGAAPLAPPAAQPAPQPAPAPTPQPATATAAPAAAAPQPAQVPAMAGAAAPGA